VHCGEKQKKNKTEETKKNQTKNNEKTEKKEKQGNRYGGSLLTSSRKLRTLTFRGSLEKESLLKVFQGSEACIYVLVFSRFQYCTFLKSA